MSEIGHVLHDFVMYTYLYLQHPPSVGNLQLPWSKRQTAAPLCSSQIWDSTGSISMGGSRYLIAHFRQSGLSKEKGLMFFSPLIFTISSKLQNWAKRYLLLSRDDHFFLPNHESFMAGSQILMAHCIEGRIFRKIKTLLNRLRSSVDESDKSDQLRSISVPSSKVVCGGYEYVL